MKKATPMLSPEQQSVIQATVPALRQHGEALTEAMYKTLFRDHPELLSVFNPANQRDGGQARSLAASILMYATHIDRLDLVGGMVEQISHKHGSLEVRPEHYPVVGQHLLAAIRTVLASSATDAVLDAWAAAYGQLAEIMIGREETLLAEGAARPGGWRGYRPLLVRSKVRESETTVSFTLADPDGQPLPPFRAGQYVGIKAHAPAAPHSQIRQYSLCNTPTEGVYRIGVKREAGAVHAPAGLISNFLHDGVQAGDHLLTHMPLGEFVLDETSDRPVVLLSGGSGITATLSMLHSLAGRPESRPVVFVHAASGHAHHAFGDEVRALARQSPNIRVAVFYEQTGEADVRGVHYDEVGRLSLSALAPYLPAGDADYYYCGPVGFLGAVGTILDGQGIPMPRRHSEAFAPDPSFETKIAAA